jgi:hypothetical protein
MKSASASRYATVAAQNVSNAAAEDAASPRIRRHR